MNRAAAKRRSPLAAEAPGIVAAIDRHRLGRNVGAHLARRNRFDFRTPAS